MSGVFVGAALGVLLWGAAIGWLVSPWLAFTFAFAFMVAVFVMLERSRGEKL